MSHHYDPTRDDTTSRAKSPKQPPSLRFRSSYSPSPGDLSSFRSSKADRARKAAKSSRSSHRGSVMTGGALAQARGLSLVSSAPSNYTISQDHTAGEEARRFSLLAGLGKKLALHRRTLKQVEGITIGHRSGFTRTSENNYTATAWPGIMRPRSSHPGQSLDGQTTLQMRTGPFATSPASLKQDPRQGMQVQEIEMANAWLGLPSSISSEIGQAKPISSDASRGGGTIYGSDDEHSRVVSLSFDEPSSGGDASYDTRMVTAYETGSPPVAAARAGPPLRTPGLPMACPLVCEFVGFVGCDAVFDPDDEASWVAHIAGSHLRNIFPLVCICWFCDVGEFKAASSSYADREACYRDRMRHIAGHFRNGCSIDQMRPDFWFLDHIHDHGLITEDMFQCAMRYHELPRIPNPGRMDEDAAKKKTTRIADGLVHKRS